MKPAHLIIPTAALAAALLAAGCGGEGEAVPAARAQKQAQADLPAGRIAFRRYLDDAQTVGALFTVNPDGTGEKQITHPTSGIDDQPDWSPDGSMIAFEHCSDDAPCSVWTVPADGSSPPAKVGVRCQLKPVCDASGPVWTPDGRLVVDLAQGREKTHGELGQIERFSLELIGKRGTQRTIFARDNWSGDAKEATVSPDGRTLVYMAWNSWKTKPANGTALYSIGIDGTRNRQLTPWTFGAGDHPAFSPDRRTVFFRSFAEDESKQADYYTVDVKTRRITRLTDFEEGTTALSGSYSPDGRWIAHGTDGLDGNADVFVMRADGSGNRPVTRSSQWDSAPDWGPSGS
jgi:Tol biopolymer transport system component